MSGEVTVPIPKGMDEFARVIDGVVKDLMESDSLQWKTMASNSRTLDNLEKRVGALEDQISRKTSAPDVFAEEFSEVGPAGEEVVEEEESEDNKLARRVRRMPPGSKLYHMPGGSWICVPVRTEKPSQLFPTVDEAFAYFDASE